MSTPETPPSSHHLGQPGPHGRPKSHQFDLDEHGWVHAEPFRRQLFHVAAATEMSPAMLAVVSRVPWRTVRRLMTGRPGRIRLKDARRLMDLRTDQIRAQLVRDAEPTMVREEFVRLAALGADAQQIAGMAKVSVALVNACLAGERVEVTWAVLWRARAGVLISNAHTLPRRRHVPALARSSLAA